MISAHQYKSINGKMATPLTQCSKHQIRLGKIPVTKKLLVPQQAHKGKVPKSDLHMTQT